MGGLVARERNTEDRDVLSSELTELLVTDWHEESLDFVHRVLSPHALGGKSDNLTSSAYVIFSSSCFPGSHQSRVLQSNCKR